MKKLIVPKKYDNKKISKFLLDSIENLTQNLFYKTLRKKDIKVNGKRISKDINIFENDEILVFIDDKFLEKNFSIETIYEDQNILIINKPANLEVTGKNSLTSYIQKEYSNSTYKPKPCHRLDRNTTGLILYAKNETTLQILLKKFKNHEIEKHYLALVYGIPKQMHKNMEAYLFKDTKKSLVYISDNFKKGYQKISTTYTVLKQYSNNTCLLDVELQTGKTHQIRAHLAHIGYPIIGDGKYGINEINKKFGKKYQELCSYSLKFNFKTNSNILQYLNGKSFTLEVYKI